MNHQQKVALLLNELASKGVGKTTIAPPIFLLAWKLGFLIPPPHFLSFCSLALMMGTGFGILWGVIEWMLVWRYQSMPVVGAVLSSSIAGVLFGLAMAYYYRRQTRKLCLPSWSDYGKDG